MEDAVQGACAGLVSLRVRRLHGGNADSRMTRYYASAATVQCGTPNTCCGTFRYQPSTAVSGNRQASGIVSLIHALVMRGVSRKRMSGTIPHHEHV